jgi:hypothetical protein
MLDWLRENEVAVHDFRGLYHAVLREASRHLKVLDPVRGEKELVKLVAAKLSRG